MSDELKKQASRERTRIIKLRYNEELETSQSFELKQAKNSFSWLPIAVIAVLCLLLGRVMTSHRMSIPQNALQPTAMAAPPTSLASPNVAVASAAPSEERITDAQVKAMLEHVNGKPGGPRPVNTGVSGQMINFSGAETPEMVRVRGEWLKKRQDNTYNVKGENVYYENKRKNQ